MTKRLKSTGLDKTPLTPDSWVFTFFTWFPA